MRMVNVLVVRDERLAIPRAIGAWEIPILQLVHGEEKVEVSDTYVDVDRELPDAHAEYQRLERRYGEDEKSGQTWASMAYSGSRGIRDLELAIKESQPFDYDPTA